MAAFAKNKLAKAISLSMPLLLSLGLSGCDDDNLDPDDIGVPSTYSFESRSQLGLSSVNYQESTTRLLLIQELIKLTNSDYLQEFGQNNDVTKTLELLNRYYLTGTKTSDTDLASVNVYDEHDPINTEEPGPTPLKSFSADTNTTFIQTDFSQLTSEINLKDKVMGISSNLIFRSETNAESGHFLGWGKINGDKGPNQLIQLCLNNIANLATDDDTETKTIYNNIDYSALLNNLLLTSIAYSEATNTLLNKKSFLTSTELTNEESKLAIEKNWDQAFGYFGASRELNPDTLATPDKTESNLFSDTNYQFSEIAIYLEENSPLNDITFASKTFKTFLLGRHLIQDRLDDKQVTNIETQAQIILSEWEHIIVAQIIRKMREITIFAPLIDLSDEFKKAYSKSWSEMKGLLIGLQYNPYSLLSYDEQIEIHKKIPSTVFMTSTSVSTFLKNMKEVSDLFQERFNITDRNAGAW